MQAEGRLAGCSLLFTDICLKERPKELERQLREKMEEAKQDEVFREWDLGKRNETFPQNDMALVLDARGFFASLLEESPETILEFSDWMGLALDVREIGRERLAELISRCVEELS